jgi:hypothetical protein
LFDRSSLLSRLEQLHIYILSPLIRHIEATRAKLVMSCADSLVSTSRNVSQSNTTDDGERRREMRTAHCHFDRLGRRSPGGATVVAARRVSKKYRSNREYLRLKAILPAVSGKKTVSKVMKTSSFFEQSPEANEI